MNNEQLLKANDLHSDMKELELAIGRLRGQQKINKLTFGSSSGAFYSLVVTPKFLEKAIKRALGHMTTELKKLQKEFEAL